VNRVPINTEKHALPGKKLPGRDGVANRARKLISMASIGEMPTRWKNIDNHVHNVARPDKFKVFGGVSRETFRVVRS
jgi:hypothetical protein